jgi:hypothetical protein
MSWCSSLPVTLHTRTGEHLDAWLHKVASSKLPELQAKARWGRERQRCGESWSHLVDQQRHGRGTGDETETDQKTGLWPGGLSSARDFASFMRSREEQVVIWRKG